MKAESIQSYLHNFAQLNQDNTQDLEECFVGFIQELFSFKNLKKSGIDLLLPLSPNPALQAFNFEDSIIYYTTTDIQSSLQEAQSGHKNLAFSLIFTSSHHKADLIAATKAINRAISSYNIIFFLSQEALSIAFATRRESLATKQKVDVLAKITLIKDIALHKPHPAHIKNLHSLTNLYTQDLPLDDFYQKLLEALSIETLNDEFFKEIKEVFLDFCDCITLPQEGANGGACEEFTKESPANPLFCHSERSEESLKESLVAKRDSSLDSQAQNDNKSQTSFSSETRSHCDKIKSHEVPPLKASSGRGIYKGEGATSQFKPLPLIEKEKRELLATPLVWHSKHCEETLPESLVAKRDSSALQSLRHDKLTAFTKNPKSNSSALPRDENIGAKSPQKQESKKSQTTQEEFAKLKREFVLRLLSRLLFCQFLEKKGLISPTLWDSTLSQNYYHEVCEPLFFGTLNTPANQREYTFLSESISTLLKSIPYLNGGLFAPHKSDYYNASNPLAYINTLQIPNACFDKLFATFARYHFTLSENTPLTQEVGLDPELLGMVFENLLSVLFTDNLKNDKDLRKATGSYYTPREIVSYMCASSLHESLKNRTNISDSKLEALIFDKDARGLEAAESKEILARLEALKILDPACGSGAFPLGMLSELLEIQTALIETSALGRHSSDLENFEGSQAHSLASPPKFSKNPQSPTANFCHSEGFMPEESLLSTKDSLTESLEKQLLCHSKHCEETQPELPATPLFCHSEGAQGATEESLSESLVAHRDSSLRGGYAQNDNSGRVSSNSNRDSSVVSLPQNDKLTTFTKNPKSNASQLMQETSRLTLYERKLKILQENIFGVDIQPMAVEIARLRCFLSLICDAPSENITPLPNLEFKFVSANSLIPLPKQEGLSYVGYEKDMAKLKALREQTFEAKDKLELESAYLALRDKIAKNIQAAWHTHKGDFSSNPLLSWNPFNPHSVAEFFDSEWMFGIKAGKNATGGGAEDSHFREIEEGWDIVLGNPPYGATYPNTHKELFKTLYMSALNIKNIQKGSLDTFSVFIEMGFNVANKTKGLCSFIVPMSVTASESMVGLHKILLANCQKIWVSSYGDRPQKIFKNAEQKVSIITFTKTLTPTQKLMMTKVNKRYATQQVSDVIKNLHFINGIDFVKKGRLPKISLQIERDILQKIYSHTDSIKHYISAQGMPIYYRTSGNRYYNLITTFPTHSTKEKHFKVCAKYQKLIGAILSSNLYFWFRSIYSNQRDTYLYEFEIMPFPIDNFSQSGIDKIEKIYNSFELDIENKANFTSTGTKEYRLRKSKSFIDEIDYAICGAYGLNEEERDFIIHYDIAFRTD